MQVDILTLFPRMFEGVLGESILKIAQEKGLAKIEVHNLRDWSTDKHRKVDAPPYGGGAGMVIMAEPVLRAVADLRMRGREKSRLVLLTPAGIPFDQSVARELSREPGLILLCGHYEGFDERVSLALHPVEISVGDFVLTGGEVPAMAVLDAAVRLLPGVLGHPQSIEDESFSRDRLEYPQFTRPAVIDGLEVPPVLLSGNHGDIAAWRDAEAERRTRERRPDLLEPHRRTTRRAIRRG